jgi:hypothetical protein
MQNGVSKHLFDYWERLRNGRVAPLRSEIDPSAIAYLLPDIFIAECPQATRTCRLRLAGTRICRAFDRELRGENLLELWHGSDRAVFTSLLESVIRQGSVGHVIFDAWADAERRARFELVLMPMAETGSQIGRVVGAISAIDPPFWLGGMPLRWLEIGSTGLVRPDCMDATPQIEEFSSRAPAQRHFRVYRGGLDGSQERALQIKSV